MEMGTTPETQKLRLFNLDGDGHCFRSLNAATPTELAPETWKNIEICYGGRRWYLHKDKKAQGGGPSYLETNM